MVMLSSVFVLLTFVLVFFFFQLRIMEADVLAALKTQAAYLSGARERPLVVVNVPTNEIKSSWSKQPLDLCLKYLVGSLR